MMQIIYQLILVAFSALISWICTHYYYRKTYNEQMVLYDKLPDIFRKIVLEDKRQLFSISELNRLLEEKTIDPDLKINGDPFPFLACPSCGSKNLKRSSVQYDDNHMYTIECTNCNWLQDS